MLYLQRIKKAIPGIGVQKKLTLHASGIGFVTTNDDLAHAVEVFYRFNYDSIFDIWNENFLKLSVSILMDIIKLTPSSV